MPEQTTPPAVSEAMREAVARDPRVDTQVWAAAATLSPEQAQQPEWLWFANDGTEGIPVARYSFGRWPKIGGAAPYVRADILLSGPIASEIARLTGELADAKSWANGYRINRELLLKRTGELHSEIARLTGERDAAVKRAKAANRRADKANKERKYFKLVRRAEHETRVAAEAETARLRAALVEIERGSHSPAWTARAALSSQEKTDV
jgi:hypothetical protein